MSKLLLTVLVIATFAINVSAEEVKVSETATKVAEAIKSTVSAKTQKVKEAAKSVSEDKTKTSSSIANTEDIYVYTADNSDGKITPETIENAFVKAGFYMSANNDMNYPYKRDFNNTFYEVYNLAAFYNKDIVAHFIKEYPKIGLFAPLSMSIYTKKGDKKG